MTGEQRAARRRRTAVHRRGYPHGPAARRDLLKPVALVVGLGPALVVVDPVAERALTVVGVLDRLLLLVVEVVGVHRVRLHAVGVPAVLGVQT